MESKPWWVLAGFALKYVLDKVVEVITTLLRSPVALILALLYLGVFRLEELKQIADTLKGIFS